MPWAPMMPFKQNVNFWLNKLINQDYGSFLTNLLTIVKDYNHNDSKLFGYYSEACASYCSSFLRASRRKFFLKGYMYLGNIADNEKFSRCRELAQNSLLDTTSPYDYEMNKVLSQRDNLQSVEIKLQRLA